MNEATKKSTEKWLRKRVMNHPSYSSNPDVTFWEYYTALCEEDRKRRFPVVSK